MNTDDLITRLDSHFRKGGFAHEYRAGVLNQASLCEFLDLVREIDTSSGCVDLRVLCRVWSIPALVEGGYQRVVENGYDRREVAKAAADIFTVYTEKFEYYSDGSVISEE